MKLLLSFLIAICFYSSCYCQANYQKYHFLDRNVLFQFGAGVGGMNCVTDIGGASSDKGYYLNEIRLQNTRLSASIYAAAIFRNFVGLRLEGTLGQVTSADNQITTSSSLNLSTKNNRNFNFKSNISELALLAEFHPLLIFDLTGGPMLLSPYLVGGVGFFSYNPKAPLNEVWTDLKPLHTEGQGFSEYPDRKPYNLSQVNVPLGLGVRYEVSTHLVARLEVVHRILFTDYLDDVSNRKYIDPVLFQKYLLPVDAIRATALANPSKNGKIPARRGNPDNNDSYMSVSFKLGYVFGKQKLY